MNVLVTGAGGFIGRHLVADQLKKSRDVTAVDLDLGALETIDDHPRLERVEADFTDPEPIQDLLAGQDVVFHLASLHLETAVDEDLFWKVNAEGSLGFVEQSHEAGVRRFVHCSTVGVYGDIEEPPADEDTECHPDIAYEKSKLAGERYVCDYAERTGYPLVVIRPAWVYGFGCPRTLKLARTIQSGRFFYVGDGKNLRHPIYIDDMLEGFELAVTHPNAPGQVLIMAGPRAVTIRTLVAIIAQELGVQEPRLRLPRPLVWAGALAVEKGFGLLGKEPPFSRRSLKFFDGDTAFAIDKARRAVGFDPRVELHEGMNHTLAEMARAGQI